MQVIPTDDGSHTIKHEVLGTTYHSKFGAFQESAHIFIAEGLAHYKQLHQVNSVSIFEMGFGTGLNAFLAMQYARENSVSIDYVTVDNLPVDATLVGQLNYGQLIDRVFDFDSMHTCPWNQPESHWANFTLTKQNIDFQEFETQHNFDVVFYHPFAPSIQPEMWEENVFLKIKSMMRNGGVLVTFSSKTSVRNCLIALGFTVEKVAGPPGKREMLRATLL